MDRFENKCTVVTYMDLTVFPINQIEVVDTPLIYTNKGRWQWDTVARDHYNLWICLEGSAEMSCDGVTYAIKPWTAFLLPPSMAIYGTSDGGFFQNFSAHWLPIGDSEFELGSSGLGVQLRDIEVVKPLINYLLRLPVYQDALGTQQLKQFVIALLGVFWRECHAPRVGVFDARIYQQIERLRSGQDLFISVDALADELKISRMHYSRCFTQLTQVAPNRFLINLRVERACVLLRQTDWTIEMIASTIGYSDAYFFSRQFRSVQGVSPGQYRAQQIPSRA